MKGGSTKKKANSNSALQQQVRQVELKARSQTTVLKDPMLLRAGREWRKVYQAGYIKDGA